jgi:hypothetical protein
MDYGFSVQQTSDSGYIITGYTDTTGAGLTDICLIKTDTDGNLIWTNNYGGTSYEEGYSVQQTSDGGYIVTGYTESYGAGDTDVYLIKTNANGDTVWTRTYGGPGPDKGYSVKQTHDGGYIVTGYRGSGVYLVKTNENGDTIWTKTYNEYLTVFSTYSVQQTNDTGYAIAGYKWLMGAGRDVFLMKTDTIGNIRWTKAYGGDNDDEGHCVQQTSDGGYVVAGWTYSFGQPIDVYVVKTSISGDTLWTRTYGGSSWDQSYSLSQTNDNGYIITGFTYSFGPGDMDVFLIKIDNNGDTVWTATFGGYSGDEGRSVQQTSDGGYIIVGHTFSFGQDGNVYLIKTEPDVGVEENITATVVTKEITATIIEGPLLLPKGKKCRVFDITGRVVEPGKMQPGIYFIEIDGVVTQKVVKVR